MATRILKATFEHVNPRKVAKELAKYNFVVGNEYDSWVVFHTEASPEEIQKAIHDMNGGAYCNVVEMTQEELEQYL